MGVLFVCCFYLSGGTSRSQLDTAAATAAELGLELAPVELQYTGAFDFGRMSFRVVDSSAAPEDAFHVKAEVRCTLYFRPSFPPLKPALPRPLLPLIVSEPLHVFFVGEALRQELRLLHA